jgi:hypothetical protein
MHVSLVTHLTTGGRHTHCHTAMHYMRCSHQGATKGTDTAEFSIVSSNCCINTALLQQKTLQSSVTTEQSSTNICMFWCSHMRLQPGPLRSPPHFQQAPPK